jgi:hypothetical protein
MVGKQYFIDLLFFVGGRIGKNNGKALGEIK